MLWLLHRHHVNNRAVAAILVSQSCGFSHLFVLSDILSLGPCRTYNRPVSVTKAPQWHQTTHLQHPQIAKQTKVEYRSTTVYIYCTSIIQVYWVINARNFHSPCLCSHLQRGSEIPDQEILRRPVIQWALHDHSLVAHRCYGTLQHCLYKHMNH